MALQRTNSLKSDQGRFLSLNDITSAMKDEGLFKCGLIFGKGWNYLFKTILIILYILNRNL